MKDEAWMHVVYLAQCAARLRSISARRDGWMVNCWMRIWTHAHILWPEKISLCHYSLVDICGNSDLSYFNVMQLKKKQKQTQMTRISHIAIMCHIADPQHNFFTLSIPFFFLGVCMAHVLIEARVTSVMTHKTLLIPWHLMYCMCVVYVHI